jgi:opacity protein-like surface antigen
MKMKKMFLAAAACAAVLAAPASAQQAPGAPEAAQAAPGTSATAQQTAGARGQTIAAVNDIRVNQLIVYGTDPCPASSEDEIIVCARRPENDRFRIPAPLRETPGPASNSWANRATELQYVGRQGIGSCSPTGAGGATGCLVQFINQARAERGGADEVNWNALIEQARQERLSRIDAESEEIEREQSTPR